MNDLLARISDWLSDVTELTGEVWLNTVDNLQVNHIATITFNKRLVCLFCLFVLLLYVPSQQLWSWRDDQFT